MMYVLNTDPTGSGINPDENISCSSASYIPTFYKYMKRFQKQIPLQTARRHAKDIR
jgi:hypothetical protein